MIYIGIDPGADGGIAVIGADGVIVKPLTTSNLISIITLACTTGAVSVAVECVNASPSMAPAKAFKFGCSYGEILGVIEYARALYPSLKSIAKVRPAAWKAAFKLSTKKRESVEMARSLYPSVVDDIYLVKHDGLAEALLIAHFLKIKEGAKK